MIGRPKQCSWAQPNGRVSGVLVAVGVIVGGTGVLVAVGVAVGGTGVLVAVGGTGVGVAPSAVMCNSAGQIKKYGA